MRLHKSWGLAIFVLLSVTTLFISSGGAEDFEGLSHGVQLERRVVDRAPEVQEVRLSAKHKGSGIGKTTHASPHVQSANLLDLVCVRLC